MPDDPQTRGTVRPAVTPEEYAAMQAAKTLQKPPELICFRRRLRAAKRLPLLLLLAAFLLPVWVIGDANNWESGYMLLGALFLPWILFADALPWNLFFPPVLLTAFLTAHYGKAALLKAPADITAFRRLTLASFLCDAAALALLLRMMYLWRNSP
jgi:hypothetical protein